ncbi:MAG TPA: T9SS type A sorting domain-containing protein [Chitinophagales bacterium]|nr:T9SS type A sorting domain-containing protein [Chitinophagales bacterium]
MKKENSTLKRKLKQYSAVAGSMLAVTGVADAQAIYTDVNPDKVLIGTNLLPGDTMRLDLNNDGITDFIFFAWKGSTYQGAGLMVPYYPLSNSNAIIGNLGTLFSHPFLKEDALAMGDNIGPGQPFYKYADITYSSTFLHPIMGYVSTGNTAGVGAWVGVQDHFLGLKFTDGANFHYGWARCSLSADADTLTLKDYAYNSIVNASLFAGQGDPLGSSSVHQQSSFNIFGYEGVVNIFVSDGKLDEATITVINMLGETVINQPLTDRNTRIDLNQFAKGIYLVTVQRGGEIFSKKISFR